MSITTTNLSGPRVFYATALGKISLAYLTDDVIIAALKFLVRGALILYLMVVFANNSVAFLHYKL